MLIFLCIPEQLRTTMEKSTSLFDKEKAQERLSKLSGGVAVFKVFCIIGLSLGLFFYTLLTLAPLFLRLVGLAKQKLEKGKIG